MRLGRRSSHFCRRTSPVRGVLTAAASSVASSMFCGSGVAGKIIRLPMALPNDDLRSVQPVEPSRPLGAYLRHSFGAVGALRRSEHRQHRCACPPLGTGRISDVTYVATWKGFIYVAFVIDAYARKIVGWRVSTSAHAGFVLDALEQAVHDRRPGKDRGLVHHSDRGRQHLSIKSTGRLAEAGIKPPVGSVGDSDDNALAETINGLLKAEVIHRRGPWRSFEAVEYATLEWVDWFNNRRLPEPIGNIPPAEAEANFDAALETEPMPAQLIASSLRQNPRGSDGR